MTKNRSATPLLMLCLLSFFSGMAALIYEVIWFRSLSLVFGGSHLAVTTTVSVFMLGLALGNWWAGRALVGRPHLLRCYAFLELGIALGAAFFHLLYKLYPLAYPPIAGIMPDSPLYLTFLRVLFGAAAMIVPTTLMGATIPVLAAFAAQRAELLARRLAWLYGGNTLGAVAGTALAGFYLLRFLDVSTVNNLAILLSGSVALAAYLAARVLPAAEIAAETPAMGKKKGRRMAAGPSGGTPLAVPGNLDRLILWGIGLSGFCALGLEVLWTRVLIIFLDASTYSFTAVLTAFLTGIGLGGAFYGIWQRRDPGTAASAGTLRQAVRRFGIIQLLIGVTTLAAMASIFAIPSLVIRLQQSLFPMTGAVFAARQLGNLLLVLILLFVPAFLMGLAVPVAARIRSLSRATTGRAAAEVLTCNTVGALLGGAGSGYVLIYLSGIERSMQLLAWLNLGLGLLVLTAGRSRRPLFGTLLTIIIGGAVFLLANDQTLKSWDTRYLGSYSANNAALYQSRSMIRDNLATKELLFYGEGAEAIVSTVRHKQSGSLSFVVNGRVEASTELADVQNQYMLGHLPMLLHPNPKKVLVVGLGSGMTLGAVSVHPSLEEVTLAEIEPKVIGVARAFKDWNHSVMDSAKLKTVINDGRNFLLTSGEKFDVITADPIHPSWRGSGYLYTDEYFRLAASHLAPGGLICQWLPLYQLSVDDLRSVLATFANNFKHVTAWVTLADVQLIGSNAPLVIDETAIAGRLAHQAVALDMGMVMMGGSRDLLTYFLTGSTGIAALTREAPVNSDDNLYLEFSSPLTIGTDSTEPANLEALTGHRESVGAYLRPLADSQGEQARAEWLKRAEGYQQKADRLQILFLGTGVQAGSPYSSTIEQRQQAVTAMAGVPDLGLWKSLKVVTGLTPLQ